jgi:P27 family predicted phage terminase small subunit
MPGPAPQPTAMKKLKGNPGRRPLNDLEPQPQHGEPPMPSGMSRYAKVAWKRIVPILLNMGVLTVADGDALMLYCEAYAQWKDAMIYLKKHGMTYEATGIKGQVLTKVSPYVAERDKAYKSMKSMLAEFGCTPSSRSRLKVEKPKDVDPLDAFLSSGTGATLRN